MKRRWLELERLFHQSVTLDDRGQAALIAAVRDRDQSLADELAALLRADQPAGETAFFNRSPVPSPWRDAFVGRALGPFVLQRKLGEGGMGLVFLAEQQHPIKRSVAVKLIASLPNDAHMQQRFEFEIQALARLNHPHIAAVYSAGATEGGLPYFAMEYVDGLPLDQYCAVKAMEFPAILDLFGMVCRAVHAAHQQGIIHRDLKPANILVTEINGEPHPKIIDFGIAKKVYAASLDDERRDLRPTLVTEAAAGTMGYMSPEQTMVPAVPLDVRCDVYALGVILYELLVGDLPLGRETLSKLSWSHYVVRVRHQQPDKPSDKVLRQVDQGLRKKDRRWAKWWQRGDLDRLCLKALAIDPAARYQSAFDLAEDCRRYLGQEPLLAGPDGFRYQFLCFFRRRRRLALGGALLAMVLLATLGGMAYSLVRTQRAEQKALREQATTAQSVLLLNQIFASVTAQQHGNQALVADQLNTLAPHINSLQVQPEVRAQLNHAVGDAYRAMGRYVLAEKYLNEAWQLRRDTLGPYAEPTMTSFLALGLNKMKRSDAYSALVFFESLEKPAEINDETRLLWISVIMARARLTAELEDLHHLPALINPDGLLQTSSTNFAGDKSSADQSWYRQMSLLLSALAIERGDWKAAASFLHDLERATEPMGPDRHLYLEGLILFAEAYNNIRTRDLAQAKLINALREIRETYHEEHPMVLRARLVQCEIWMDGGQVEKALGDLCELAGVFSRAVDDEIMVLDWVALAHAAAVESGHPDWGRQVVAGYFAQNPPNQSLGFMGVRRRLFLAEVLMVENEASALDIACDAFGLLDDLGHPSPGTSARTAKVIGRMFAARGRYDQAEAWACVARSFAETMYGYSGIGSHPYIDDHLTAMRNNHNPGLAAEIDAMQAAIEDQSHNMKRFWFRLKDLEDELGR